MPSNISSSDGRHAKNDWIQLGRSGVRCLCVEASAERKARETSKHFFVFFFFFVVQGQPQNPVLKPKASGNNTNNIASSSSSSISTFSSLDIKSFRQRGTFPTLSSTAPSCLRLWSCLWTCGIDLDATAAVLLLARLFLRVERGMKKSSCSVFCRVIGSNVRGWYPSVKGVYMYSLSYFCARSGSAAWWQRVSDTHTSSPSPASIRKCSVMHDQSFTLLMSAISTSPELWESLNHWLSSTSQKWQRCKQVSLIPKNTLWPDWFMYLIHTYGICIH